MLHIVSTPIGNLKDITLRALETLKAVDLIAAEDTRHTRRLLQHYGIEIPLTSYFEHNKLKKADTLIGMLKQGKNIALVTDAGTPGISDPGYHLIRLAKQNGIAMTVVPGACALIAALTASGLPPDRFTFLGFLPVKQKARQDKLREACAGQGTVIFYESPHRLVKTLKDIRDVTQVREVVCARELTKKFEEIKSGTPGELAEYFLKHKPRGEFVLLFSSNSIL